MRSYAVFTRSEILYINERKVLARNIGCRGTTRKFEGHPKSRQNTHIRGGFSRNEGKPYNFNENIVSTQGRFESLCTLHKICHIYC